MHLSAIAKSINDRFLRLTSASYSNHDNSDRRLVRFSRERNRVRVYATTEYRMPSQPPFLPLPFERISLIRHPLSPPRLARVPVFRNNDRRSFGVALNHSSRFRSAAPPSAILVARLPSAPSRFSPFAVSTWKIVVRGYPDRDAALLTGPAPPPPSVPRVARRVYLECPFSPQSSGLSGASSDKSGASVISSRYRQRSGATPGRCTATGAPTAAADEDDDDRDNAGIKRRPLDGN